VIAVFGVRRGGLAAEIAERDGLGPVSRAQNEADVLAFRGERQTGGEHLGQRKQRS